MNKGRSLNSLIFSTSSFKTFGGFFKDLRGEVAPWNLSRTLNLGLYDSSLELEGWTR